MAEAWTVGAYLARRIAQAGAGHVFGVPGDYVLPFLDEVVRSDLELVTTCNELNAAYAADGYARLRGVGAVAVTYVVGGLSAVNGVAGAFAERVPLIVVSGAPRTTAAASRRVLHHSLGDPGAQCRVYREVTAAAVRLTDPGSAPGLIDDALAACLRERRPCYVELPLDVAGAACEAPAEYRPDTSPELDPGALREAVADTTALLRAAGGAGAAPVAGAAGPDAPPVAVIAGVEALRLGVAAELLALVDRLGAPFVTTVASKGVLPEAHALFAGVYIGGLGQAASRDVVEGAGAVLALGALMTDLDLGLYTARLDERRLVVARRGRVEVAGRVYDRVPLGAFLHAMRAAAAGTAVPEAARPGEAPTTAHSRPVPGRPITVARFYERMASFLEPRCIVLADGGDSMLSAAQLPLPERSAFLVQAFYASIGWTLPATLGALCAEPGRPVRTFVGDGSFQMTAQELSTVARRRRGSAVFVADNGGYGVERLIHDGPYNDLAAWEYADLAAAVGGSPGRVVRTEDDLERALAHVTAHPDELTLVQVKLAWDDASETLRRFGAEGRH